MYVSGIITLYSIKQWNKKRRVFSRCNIYFNFEHASFFVSPALRDEAQDKSGAWNKQNKQKKFYKNSNTQTGSSYKKECREHTYVVNCNEPQVFMIFLLLHTPEFKCTVQL